MKPSELKAARHRLGLSAQGMADALGIADGRTVRHWESGARPVTRPVALLVRYMLKYGLPDKAL